MMITGYTGRDLFDNFFNTPWYEEKAERRPEMGKRPAPHKENRNLMLTDIIEMENGYELQIDLPGYKKDEIHAELQNGYLTVTAQKKEESAENRKYIRKERFSGKCQRVFYVGDALTIEDIKASFANGVLTLSVPKETAKKQEQPKYISIEG